MAPGRGTYGRGTYSRLVRILRVGLPLLGFGLLAAVFLISPEEELEGGLVFQDSDLARLGDGLQLKNPQLSGKTRDGAVYVMSALRVSPKDNALRSADFEQIDGDVKLPDGRVVTIEARTANFDMDSQRMTFSEGVVLTTSDGYRMKAAAMTAELDNAVFLGRDGVEVTGPEGRITARNMRLETGSNGGKKQILYFHNAVKVHISSVGVAEN